MSQGQGNDTSKSRSTSQRSKGGQQTKGGKSGGAGTNRTTSGAESRTSGIGRMGSDAMSSIGDAAHEAGRQARDAAGSLASQANEQVRMLVDRQVSVGADLVADVADSVRAAADSLDENVPQLAHLARGAAGRIEDFSESVRDQSATDLFQTTSAFARRRPAALFGAAAIGGFLLVRLLTATPARDFDDYDDDDDDWNGDRDDDDWDSDLATLGDEGGIAGPRSGGGTYGP